jgi:Predicted dehydrogenases and related proteins
MKSFNVGIIGLGTVAQVHVRVLSSIPNVRIKAVCDVKGPEEIDVPSGAAVYTDYMKMLDEEKLDAVHICLPHYLHYPVATECARRRIPTLLEKPVVLTGKKSRLWIPLSGKTTHWWRSVCRIVSTTPSSA